QADAVGGVERVTAPLSVPSLRSRLVLREPAAARIQDRVTAPGARRTHTMFLAGGAALVGGAQRAVVTFVVADTPVFHAQMSRVSRLIQEVAATFDVVPTALRVGVVAGLRVAGVARVQRVCRGWRPR